MDNHFHHAEFNTNRAQLGKRGRDSGRLSPRALFGNLRSKKPFMDEQPSTSRNWKPPIKIDPNNNNNDQYSSSFQNKYNSSQNDAYSPQKHYFGENEPNSPESNENLCMKEHFPFEEDDESANESFGGNSEETVPYGEYSKQTILGNVHHKDFQQKLQNYNNNNEKCVKPDDAIVNKIELSVEEPGPSSRNINQELDINDYLVNNVSNAKQENSQDNLTFDSANPQSKSTDELNMKDNQDLRHNFELKENEEYSYENNDHVKSTLEYIEEAKKLLAGSSNMTNKSGSHLGMNPHNEQEEINEPLIVPHDTVIVRNEIDDPFDLALTNSQFLQIEKQVTKNSSNAVNKSFNSNQMSNTIEAIKRCSSSLSVQTEWQKNIVRTLIKDVDELNKSVVNAIASLKSIRRNNVPKK